MENSSKTSLPIIALLLSLFSLYADNAYAGIFGPSNYWECILENIPGTQNDGAAYAIIRKCKNDFDKGSYVEKSSSWFGPKTRDECIIKYGKNVSGDLPGELLEDACNKLYD